MGAVLPLAASQTVNHVRRGRGSKGETNERPAVSASLVCEAASGGSTPAIATVRADPTTVVRLLPTISGMKDSSGDPSRCSLCGRDVPMNLITLHHLTPRQKGGKAEHRTP